MHILPVKPIFGTHQRLCSSQGSSPVRIKHLSTSCRLRARSRVSGLRGILFVLALLICAGTAFAQGTDTIQQIRVIGNRRIPKETILARLFTHVGDTYDPISTERDFQSLWNTGYFDDLRIEREDSEKGIILDVFVREKPNIREINYKGLSTVSVSGSRAACASTVDSRETPGRRSTHFKRRNRT